MASDAPAAPPPAPPGLGRRLGAAFYDSLLVFGLMLLATAAVLPVTGGEAVPSGTAIYDLYLLGVGFLYFGWCWTRPRGQTLGMKTWKIRVQTLDGARLGWGLALARYVTALVAWLPLGLGFVWAAFDPQRRAWHDRASGTVLVRVDE